MLLCSRLFQVSMLLVALFATVAAVPEGSGDDMSDAYGKGKLSGPTGPTHVSRNKIKILQRSRNLRSIERKPDDFHSYYNVDMDLHLEDSAADSTLEFTWPNGQVRSFIGGDYQASWSGQSENGGRANLIHQSDTDSYHGSFVDYGGGNWTICQLGPDANGNHLMDCADGADFPEEADALVPEDIDQADRALLAEKSEAERVFPHEIRSLQEGVATIDIMVLWTKQAECGVSALSHSCTPTAATKKNMRGRVDLAVQETNTAYGLSGINAELRLVHAYREPSYVEAASNAYLTALNNLVDVDGAMDDVHAKRQQYGADVVALLIDDPELCGIAYVGPSRSFAFSVTSWSCATGIYSFGHEIAHNLGCKHDRGTADECGASGYNYGYREPQGDFRTTLAYSCRTDQCDSNAAASSCPRVQIYSNNYGYTYNGAIAGDANNDNARQINEVASTVAAFYDPPDVDIPTSGPTNGPTMGLAPSDLPSDVPSDVPSQTPSETTSGPTNGPTMGLAPSDLPSGVPSDVPSQTPSETTSGPSDLPSGVPSDLSSDVPSDVPSQTPSETTSGPSDLPSGVPSELSSDVPSDIPSQTPSDTTSGPSDLPSGIPSELSSDVPSDVPSQAPSETTGGPTDGPAPSDLPSDVPSDLSSDIPSDVPSQTPSLLSVTLGPINFDDLYQDGFLYEYKGLTWTNLMVSDTNPPPPSFPFAAVATETTASIEIGEGVFSLIRFDLAGTLSASPVIIRGFDQSGAQTASKTLAFTSFYATYDLSEFENIARIEFEFPVGSAAAMDNLVFGPTNVASTVPASTIIII